MNDLFIFVLLFVAIAIGWFLGRRGSLESSSQQGHSGRYFQSLDDLLSGRPDGAIDAFINGLEVSSETVETHFALGTQLRQKGELERAVRVHQNLLAGPALPLDQLHLAHLELARDYISGGLLDRAEQLLLELVRGSSRQRLASQRPQVAAGTYSAGANSTGRPLAPIQEIKKQGTDHNCNSIKSWSVPCF